MELENTIIQPDNTTTNAVEDETKTECDCCCDNFNKGTRSKITCHNPQCNFTICKACARQYLLSTTEAPHCMDCKVAWSQRFIVSNLNISFINTDYKKHRKVLLTDRQISMLPETMPAVARAQKKDEYDEKQNQIAIKIKELRAQIRDLNNEEYQNRIQYYNETQKTPEETSRKFILPCPDENCRGFLSTAYKCELCNCYACSKCLVITGKERHDPDHVCDEELVKTTQLIRNSSKPCPTCGERIMKASGCDQMWCTKCQTAFSWTTGKIDTGNIHNPHYFQYQRANPNAQIVRNPQDQICGGVPNNWWQIRNMLRQVLLGKKIQTTQMKCSCEHIQMSGRYTIPSYADENEKNILARQYHSDLIEKFTELFHTLRHINGHELRTYRTQVRELDNHEDLRVNYLLNKISKENMAKELAKRDKKRSKMIEMMHIYELFVAVGNDLTNYLSVYIQENNHYPDSCHFICKEFTKKLEEFDTFIDYVNNQLKHISVTYSQKVPQFSKLNYESTRVKFKMSDLETSL